MLKHKVALQPNKHVATWLALCKTLQRDFEGDVRNLFTTCKWDIPTILHYMQKEHKRIFPIYVGRRFVTTGYTLLALTPMQS